MGLPGFPGSMVEIVAPSFNYTKDEASATRKFLIQTVSEIDDALEAFWGQPLIAGTQIIPPEVASFPGRSYLKLQSVSIDPFASDMVGALDSDGVASCPSGLVCSLSYSSRGREKETEDEQTGQTISIETKYDHENLRLAGKTGAGKGFKWAVADAAGKVDISKDVPVHKIIPIEEWTISIRNALAPSWTNIKGARGKVNDDTFLGYSAAEVLLMGVSASNDGQDRTTGRHTWDLSFSFKCKQIPYVPVGGGIAWAGWNHLLREEVDPAVDPLWQVTDPLLYLDYDFRLMFQAEAGDIRADFLNLIWP